MKQKILSVILLIGVLAFVTANCVVLANMIDEITVTIEDLSVSDENASKRAESAFELYNAKAKYIGFTVSHDDLTNIEDCFVELIGYLSVGDTKNAEVTKGRLINSLEHLRRLSGFNIDAII